MGKTAGSGKHPGLYKRDRYWWLTLDPVEGRAISTRCTTLKAAVAFQAERERLGADPAYAASKKAELGDWCDRFLDMKRATKRSPETLSYLRQKLGHWIRIHGRGAPLSTFTNVRVFNDYLKQRRDEGATLHTVSKEVKVFRQVLSAARREKSFAGEMADLRPDGLETSYVPRERALTSDELRRLLMHCKPWHANLVCLTVAIGCRLSEALKLSQVDVDLAGGLVHIRGTKTKGSNRQVPILSPFRPFLERVFPELPLGPKPNNLRRDLLAACRKAGIEAASPNDFRRTHASILAELGAGEEQVAKLLGHSSVEMVRKVYSRPRALATGALIEASIGERSAGVVTLASYGECSPVVAVAKCAESHNVATESPYSTRLPKPKVTRSNRVGGAAKAPTGLTDCSAGVVDGAQGATFRRFSLAKAAHRLGQLHDAPVERPAIGLLEDEVAA